MAVGKEEDGEEEDGETEGDDGVDERQHWQRWLHWPLRQPWRREIKTETLLLAQFVPLENRLRMLEDN